MLCRQPGSVGPRRSAANPRREQKTIVMYRVWLLIEIYGLNIFNLAGQEVEQGYLAAVRAAESLGPDDLRLAKTWNNLGTFYQGRGRYDEAEALHRRAATAYE